MKTTKGPQTIFACQECGNQSSKWLGRCPECGNWNTYVEEQVRPEPSARSGARRVAIRVQGQYSSIYRRLIARGARVRWTDLRMSMHDFAEVRPADGGIVLSNWEI